MSKALVIIFGHSSLLSSAQTVNGTAKGTVTRSPQLETTLNALNKMTAPMKVAQLSSILNSNGANPNVQDVFDKVSASHPQLVELFLKTSLPIMIRAVSSIPATMPYLEKGDNATISLTPKEAFSQLSRAFFGLPLLHNGQLMDNDVFQLFGASQREYYPEKLKCMLQYFNVMSTATSPELVNRSIDFIRYGEIGKRPLDFSTVSGGLSKIEVVDRVGGVKATIESCANCVQADFANKNLGGAVLSHGNVQEEIRMIIAPELIVGRFFNAEMDPRESILMKGSVEFSTYTGYNKSFKYNGAVSGPYRQAEVLAIDAVKFRQPGSTDEASKKSIDRELEKVRIALKSKGTWKGSDIFATGNWGAGAFNGDVQLKAIIQWLAASVNGAFIKYYSYGDKRATGLGNFIDEAKKGKWTVADVYNAITNAPQGTISGMGYFKYVSTQLSGKDKGKGTNNGNGKGTNNGNGKGTNNSKGSTLRKGAKNDKGGLLGWHIALIVVGCLLLVGGGVWLVFYFKNRA